VTPILKTFLLLASVVLIPTLPLREAGAQAGGLAEIDVTIPNVRNLSGKIGCQLFASADGFPRDTTRAIARTVSLAAGPTASCDFRGLKPGAYAVAVMHDENDNGVVDTNLFGAPIEGYGVSNNHTYALKPPSWEESRFSLADAEHKRIEIRLRY
jgi:uncharacterized protein (DUF2141 family)